MTNKRPYLPLPALINPQGRQCVTLYIPDDIDHITAFWGYLWGITRWFNWERDNTQKGKAVASVWEEIFWDGRERWLAGECGDCDTCEGCTEYTSDSRFIEYQPNDPHRTPNLVPTGYLSYPPWAVAGDGNILYDPGTVYTDLSRLPTDFLDIITNLDFAGFPRLKIRFSGSGRVLLHLQQIPLGGLALITVDGEHESAKIVDLSSFDVFEIQDYLEALETLTNTIVQGGLNSLQIVEINIEGEGEHYIDLTMLPKIAPIFPTSILGFGGAFKKVEFCGFSAQEICEDCPEPEPPTPPTIRAGSDCIEWLNPETNEWECIASYPELGLEKSAATGCDVCGCECESEECMCNCDGSVRYDPCTQKLQYRSNGTWQELPVSNLTADVGVITPPEDTPETADNMCYKATGVWKVVEMTVDAIIASTTGRGMLDAYIHFQKTYPQIDEDNLKLHQITSQYNDSDSGESIEAGTASHWNTNKATIKADFICAMQYQFSNSTTLGDREIDKVREYQASTGSNQLNEVLEACLQLPERQMYKNYAASAITSQQGECDCTGAAPIDRTGDTPAPDAIQWIYTFNFKSNSSVLGWAKYNSTRPDPIANANGMTAPIYTVEESGSNVHRLLINAAKSLPYADSTTRITQVQAYWSALTQGTGNVSGLPVVQLFTTNAAGTLLAGGNAPSNIPTLVAASYQQVFNGAQVYTATDLLKIFFNISQKNGDPILTGATGYVEKIVITGSGKNPFIAG